MKKGFTLIEVLIAGALLFTLIALSVRVFIPALSIWRRNQAKASVQQAALAAAYRIRHDVMHSAPGLIQVRPSFMLILKAQSFDPEGAPLWSEWVGYWLDDRQQLWRFSHPIPPVTEPPSALPAGLPTVEDLSQRGHVVARDVQEFVTEVGPTRGVRYGLTLKSGPFRYELLTGAVSAYQEAR